MSSICCPAQSHAAIPALLLYDLRSICISAVDISALSTWLISGHAANWIPMEAMQQLTLPLYADHAGKVSSRSIGSTFQSFHASTSDVSHVVTLCTRG